MKFSEMMADIVGVIYPYVQTTKAQMDTLNIPALSQAVSSVIMASETATDKAAIATTKAEEVQETAQTVVNLKNEAEDARDAAAQSATNAHNSEQNINQTITTAVTSATQIATNKATIATTKAADAAISATEANSAKTASESARDASVQSATNAHNSEQNVSQTITTAVTSATQIATDKAGIATTKATEATNARNAAIQSAADAQTIKDSIWNIHVPIGWTSGSGYVKTWLVIDPTTLLTYIANKDIVSSTIEPHLDDANFDLYTINTVDINGNTIHMRIKCGTIAQLTGVVLQLGEMAYVIDNGNIKVGDGITAFEALAYQGENTPAVLALQSAVVALNTALALKADKSSTYTKTEVDTAQALKADKSSTYTKTEVDTAQALKADKTAIDSLKDGSTKTIKNLDDSIATITALLTSNDVNLDTIQEIVTYIKSEQTLIDSITTNKVNVADIVDTLTSTLINKPLSAAQGKVLKDALDSLVTTVANNAVPTAIHASAAKTTLVDADELGFLDSGDSFMLKKLTWAKLQSMVAGKGFKNYIINGNFDVWQRGIIGFTTGYFADRWQIISGFSDVGQNFSSSPTGAYSSAYLRRNASGAMIFSQRIESMNIKNMASKTITLSFNIRVVSGSLTNVVVEFLYPTATDNFTTTTSISSSTLTQSNDGKSSVTITLPANAINGLEVKFTLNVVGDTAVTFNQCQLEEGSIATPFEQRPYGLELILCQRYFEKKVNAETNNQDYGHPCYGNNSNTAFYGNWDFCVTKRTVPTVSAINCTGTNGFHKPAVIYSQVNSITAVPISTNRCQIALITNDSYASPIGFMRLGYLTASSEL